MAHVHRVQRGECIASIGVQRGLTVDAIWNHPRNAELRSRRRSPYVLAEGDLVYVPDIVPGAREAVTDRCHRFRRKGVPELFRLRLVGIDGPRAHVPYVFNVDGEERSGQTDGDGWIVQRIPPDARTARIELGDDRVEVLSVRLGGLAPETTELGARQRLLAARYLSRSDVPDDLFVFALMRFQSEHELTVTGTLTDETCAALRRLHGS